MKAILIILISVSILLILFWKFRHKLQLTLNRDLITLYTPKVFTSSHNRIYIHDCITNQGFEYAKSKKIIIAGLVRDVLKNLPMIEKRAEKIGALFKDYRVLIVENDSKDDTRKYLLDWVKRNPKIKILGCEINIKKCNIGLEKTKGHLVYRNRIEKMAFLRNKYLEEIRQNYANFDFVAVWDMDIVGSIYLDGIANSMGYFKRHPIDGMCAYGIYKWGPLKLFYDTYAFLEPGDTFHIDQKILHDIKKGLGTQYNVGDFPVKVVSCFSGFTIYKIQSIIPAHIKYGTSLQEDDNLECEHSYFNKNLQNLYMNPSMVHLVLLNK